MSNQAPYSHPTHFVNSGNTQYIHYGLSHMPPMFPPNVLRPSFAPQFPYPQYARPMPIMPYPYGQFQAHVGPVNPAYTPIEQVAQAHPGTPQTPAGPGPQALAPASKNRPNHEICPEGKSIFMKV